MVLLTEIPFVLNASLLCEDLRIKPGTERAREFEDLVDVVQEIGRPKALYGVSSIDAKGDGTVTLEGVTFTSRALRRNLDSIERVFPYVATCGAEIDDLETGQGELRKKLWISFLKERLLYAGIQFLTEHLIKRYKVSNLSSMNPGSGDASVWPFEQQRELLSLCGDIEGLIGVRITKSMALVPDMSVAGILFPTEIDFHSCQLCQRENCRSRRAPYDGELWESINRNSMKHNLGVR